MSGQKTIVALKQMLWQLPLLLAAAGVLALGVNALRSDGIPLVEDWSAEARSVEAAGEKLVVDPAMAQQLFESGAALFVDARPANQYARGHIRGAVSLPWQQVDDCLMDVLARLETAGEIITYCDGVGCDLSHELALFLKESGFDNVRELINGWTVWQQAGLPTAVEDGRHE